ELKPEGFALLDRAIGHCARHGLYAILDFHALPGAQNQHWHSDNATHLAGFWSYRHFQDRAVHLWVALAERYRGNATVAGYNIMNEPADPSGMVSKPSAPSTATTSSSSTATGTRPTSALSKTCRSTRTLSTPPTTMRCRASSTAAPIRAYPAACTSIGKRSRRRSCAAPSSCAAPARRSGSVSSARCSRATRSATSKNT